MLQSREVVRAFKLGGLGIGKEALSVLSGHLATCSDAQAEITRVIQCVKASGELTSSIVSVKLIQDALQTEGTAEEDAGEDIVVLDHRAVPIFEFDTVRQTFLRKPGIARSLAESHVGKAPFNRINAFRERFKIIEQRVRRHKVFAKPAFSNTRSDRQELTHISGLRRAEGTVCTLGLLTQTSAGRFFLEDGSHSIEVDISQARSTTGLFTENCTVIVEGAMCQDVFIAHGLAMPPLEERSETAKLFPALAVPQDRPMYSEREAQQLVARERADVNTDLIVLSDVWLDRPNVVNGLKHMLGKYDEMCEEAASEGEDKKLIFVMMGNFTSVATPDYAKHSAAFEELATIIESLPNLLDSSMFIFVPGPNDVDLGGGDLLPRKAMPNSVTSSFQDRIPSSEFTSSPCRIKFYTQEIVLHREDMCMTLRKHSRNPVDDGGATSLFVHAMQTVLKQGHLRPLPLHAGPIEWSFDHALRLYPLPTVMFVGDRSERADAVIGGAKVANPGSFANDLTFYSYHPSTPVDGGYGELVACQVSVDSLASVANAAPGQGLKKRLKKKSKSKAKRESTKEGDEEKTPKDRKEKKSRSKTTPPGNKETAGMGIGAFFAPSARGQILQEEETEAGVAYRGRKRIRQVVDSDEESDASSSSEEEEEEEEEGEEEGGVGGGGGGGGGGLRDGFEAEQDAPREEGREIEEEEEGEGKGEGEGEGEGDEGIEEDEEVQEGS